MEHWRQRANGEKIKKIRPEEKIKFDGRRYVSKERRVATSERATSMWQSPETRKVLVKKQMQVGIRNYDLFPNGNQKYLKALWGKKI